jgi:hypothetical protein
MDIIAYRARRLKAIIGLLLVTLVLVWLLRVHFNTASRLDQWIPFPSLLAFGYTTPNLFRPFNRGLAALALLLLAGVWCLTFALAA